VEIVRYQTANQGLACIRIGINVSGQRSFLRVNDLEGRQLIKWEREWNFTR
jgi:hypothetical protein